MGGKQHSLLYNCCPYLDDRLSSSLLVGQDWSSFNLARQWPRRQRAELYGSNDVTAGRPNLLLMAAQQLAQPLFIVQVLLCMPRLSSDQFAYRAVCHHVCLVKDTL